MENIQVFFAHQYAFVTGQLSIILIALIVWSLVWKGFALWFSARNYQKKWFIAILILNTAGFVEIIYLLFFRRDKQPGVTQSLFETPLPNPEEDTEEKS